MSLIATESVTVITPSVEHDELGESIIGEPSREEVGGVVVCPGPTSDLDATRPDGARVAFSVFFPKGYSADLRGCSVVVRGVTCEVVGWPQRYADEHAPGELNMVAEVVAVDG